MTRKKENYDLWLKEIRERRRIRNAKRREKRNKRKMLCEHGNLDV